MSLKRLGKLIQTANTKQAPEKLFLNAYNDVVVKGRENRPPSNRYKPSSLGGCLRNIYFQRITAPTDKAETLEPELVEMGENGTDRHERIQEKVMRMKELGHDVEWIDVEEFLKRRPVEGTKVVQRVGPEVKLYNETYNISLMCDGIVKIEGVYYVLEIKTEISFKWQGRGEPDEKHRTQAATYSLVLNIPRVLFFYENRDILKKKPYIIEIGQEEIAERVLNTIETVEEAILTQTVPPKTDKPSECKWCNFKEECKRW